MNQEKICKILKQSNLRLKMLRYGNESLVITIVKVINKSNLQILP